MLLFISTFIVFLVLKLTKVIAWSWWWITAPLWGAAGIGLLFAVTALVVGLSISKQGDRFK